MCGIGSWRRWHYDTRDTISEYLQLDLRRLQREQLLVPGKSCRWNWRRGDEAIGRIDIRTEFDRVILKYRHRQGGADWTPMEYAVRLGWTSCTFGGQRAWFRCPAQGCGRRVPFLYLGGAGIFACRKCYGLVYASQREPDDDLAARRAERLRERMGWEPGILNGESGKPKGMHWRTFERLKAEYDGHVDASLAGMAQRIGMIERRLGGIDELLKGDN